MSGKNEKEYIKIKDKLQSLSTRITRLEKAIFELRKDLKNVNIENVELEKVLSSRKVNKKGANFIRLRIIQALMFIALFSFLLFYYYYKNDNAMIVLKGIPERFKCINFRGSLEMSPEYITINKGTIVNRCYIKAIVDKQEFQVKPGDLKIVFDSNKNKADYGIPYANFFRTSNKNIRISTNTNSEYYASATQLLFKRDDNVDEYALIVSFLKIINMSILMLKISVRMELWKYKIKIQLYVVVEYMYILMVKTLL